MFVSVGLVKLKTWFRINRRVNIEQGNLSFSFTTFKMGLTGPISKVVLIEQYVKELAQHGT